MKDKCIQVLLQHVSKVNILALVSPNNKKIASDGSNYNTLTLNSISKYNYIFVVCVLNMMKTLILATVKSQIHVMTVYFEIKKRRKALDLLLFHFAAFYCVDYLAIVVLSAYFQFSGQAFSLQSLCTLNTHRHWLRGGKKGLHSTAELFCRRTL